MTRTLLLSAFALAACSGEAPTSTPGNAAAPIAKAPAPPAPPAPPRATSGRIEEKNDLLEFTYAWPAEAAAVPMIVNRFREEARAAEADALAAAGEDKAAREDPSHFNGHYFSKVWEATGQSPRLLSLAAEIATFTGGAHGNVAYQVLLWDRAASRDVAFAELFADRAAAFRLLEPAYCADLDAQRAEKREEPLPLKGDDWMVACPKLADTPVALVDADRDRRFEAVKVLLAPYEAGPYAEGAYEVEIVLGDEVRAAAKPEYRESFAE